MIFDKFIGVSFLLLVCLIFIVFFIKFVRQSKIKQEEKVNRKVAKRVALIEKELSEDKANFLSHISHELITPLAVIDSAIQILETQAGLDNEVVNERHRRIRQSVSHLNSVLDNTISVEYFENKTMRICAVKFLLEGFVENIVNKAANDLSRCDIQIATSFYCLADRRLLNQALTNLMSNAVRYSMINSKVMLWSKKAIEANREGSLIIISNMFQAEFEPDTQQWFKKYNQQKEHLATGGIGVGLCLVKQIAQAHGGYIRCLMTACEDDWKVEMHLWLPDNIKGEW